MGMTIYEHIAQLKKLKSFHNGSYGASINFAIETMRKFQKLKELDEALRRDLDLELTVETIPKDQINKAIEKIEQYICDVETDTVKAQGMAQALDMLEQTLGGLEDGNDKQRGNQCFEGGSR